MKFKQSHTLSDIRLGLGYTAFAISAACFYWDYKFGWDATKQYTAVAVALYALLNGALTGWIYFVEKNKVYIGTSKNGDKVRSSTLLSASPTTNQTQIEVSTTVKKHVSIYNLTATYTYASSPKIPNSVSISKPFAEWFDASGKFVALPFQQMLASEVPVIGKADPARALKPEADLKELQETLMAADAVATAKASGSAVSGEKTRSRKKA